MRGRRAVVAVWKAVRLTSVQAGCRLCLSGWLCAFHLQIMAFGARSCTVHQQRACWEFLQRGRVDEAQAALCALYSHQWQRNAHCTAKQPRRQPG